MGTDPLPAAVGVDRCEAIGEESELFNFIHAETQVSKKLAESEGFEPPNGLPRLLISNQVPSAARPALPGATRTPRALFCIRPSATSRSVGGEGGIRTHDTLPYTRFPSVRLRPLGHLSVRSGGRPYRPPVPPRASPGTRETRVRPAFHRSFPP